MTPRTDDGPGGTARELAPGPVRAARRTQRAAAVAGIAFLWLIGVIRDRVGASEVRLIATVFPGSGLMLTAMLFVAVAAAARLSDQVGAHYANVVNSGTWGTGRHVVGELMSCAMRLAGVFTIATSTVLLRTRTMASWTALIGYVIGLAVLSAVGNVPSLQPCLPHGRSCPAW